MSKQEAEAKTMPTISVEMFKMWIEGIEEMQDPDWTPTPTQWKRIRQKIDQLDDTPAAPAVVSHPHNPMHHMEAPYGNLMPQQQQQPQAWGGYNAGHQGPAVVGRSHDGNPIYDAPSPITPT